MILTGLEIAEACFGRHRSRRDVQACRRQFAQWRREVEAAEWRHFADVKSKYRSADQASRKVIFNISGNRYRLIVAIPPRIRRGGFGDPMRTELIVIENDCDYAEARQMVRELMDSDRPSDVARLRAQSLLLQDWERKRRPAPPADALEAIRFRIEQLQLQPKSVAALFGAPSRVSEVMSGKRGLSLAMIRRLHRELDIPLEVLVGGLAPKPSEAGRAAAEAAGLRTRRVRRRRD
jgi:HTH-type transcriptional regulator / antitoxin HigA